jgi:hypothetical protein
MHLCGIAIWSEQARRMRRRAMSFSSATLSAKSMVALEVFLT